jgi:hypothetical protein
MSELANDGVLEPLRSIDMTGRTAFLTNQQLSARASLQQHELRQISSRRIRTIH